MPTRFPSNVWACASLRRILLFRAKLLQLLQLRIMSVDRTVDSSCNVLETNHLASCWTVLAEA
jgi:hypothetical protein